ncbi:GIY-YIG nuclease family protein [Mesorhizobium sp. B2-4-2]|uniref:GIY-YIG nuclease family protein n=1 Tax=Mesorhizobium sp. B2-4-2 TaxID=2589947 RepID=UPI001125F62B|nr:GIY-YIG nuclease family protein [Mesorhizobium sp. B2-4-2]TPL47998.1 GIY-YIG nuclease family protein [Mesorhizobium sp. B2-4-2]
MTRLTLEQILSSEDHDGLLDVKPATSAASSDASRITHDFEELNRFIDQYGYVPGEGPSDRKPSVKERVLSMRLKGYRDNRHIAAQLTAHDRHGLLADETATAYEPASVEEILGLDDELLNTASEDIFHLRHARPRAARPDKVSERKPAKDFQIFKPLFDACVADLVSGKRKSIKFANEQEINAGEFFILNGIMVYVAEVNDPHFRNGKRNARLRLIFENGTEGENLLRSLATELYKDPSGRRISSPEAGPLFGTEPATESVAAPKGRVTGCIYVVRSLSAAPEIVKLDGHLFKIGFTTGPFEERIRMAKDDPTFLLAPVHPVRTYDAIDLNANKFENLLHRFFGEVRLNIEIMDRFGRPFKPKEWFLLPLSVIEQAIPMLLDGSILHYRYDSKAGVILPVKAS